ncbi:MAG TPA: hypothetical protein VH120_01435 [Gemmataceae bacterium]|nr:hypothetical protein [Gemmataceae bacterium]
MFSTAQLANAFRESFPEFRDYEARELVDQAALNRLMEELERDRFGYVTLDPTADAQTYVTFDALRKPA